MDLNIIAVAEWLNKTFFGFDNGILTAYHNLGEATGYGFFRGFFRFISYFADHGYGMLILSWLMILVPMIPPIFKKNPETAKKVILCGLTAFCAIGLGAVFTNLLIKTNVARLRPYDTLDVYRTWWERVGSVVENDYSFPSGHTTCTMAAMTSIFLCFKKKYSWTAFIFVLLMGMSRNYLMVHYPTDIVGGLIIGGLAALASAFIWRKLFAIIITSTKRGKLH